MLEWDIAPLVPATVIVYVPFMAFFAAVAVRIEDGATMLRQGPQMNTDVGSRVAVGPCGLIGVIVLVRFTFPENPPTLWK